MGLFLYRCDVDPLALFRVEKDIVDDGLFDSRSVILLDLAVDLDHFLLQHQTGKPLPFQLASNPHHLLLAQSRQVVLADVLLDVVVVPFQVVGTDNKNKI